MGRPHTVGLDETAVERAIDVACGFVKLAEQMRQDAMHETLASGEWMEWLKYGACGSPTCAMRSSEAPLTW